MTRSNRREFLSGVMAGAAAAGLMARAGEAGAQGMAGKITLDDRALLVIVDVQNDFIPGGALPVKEGDQIVPLVNKIAAGFRHVILTQDWHTPGHISFASTHAGKKPFETVALDYGTQVLWPDHCVQGTKDAELVPGLQITHAQLVIRKGYRRHIDSYSAFFEADGKTPTGLTGYLRERGIQQTFFVGLATDFCVAWSALDARKSGFAASVIEDATRGIDAGGSLGKAWQDMTGAGVKRITSADIELS